MAIGFEKWAESINAEASKGLEEAKKMLAEEKKREARDEARLKEMRELAKKIDSFKKEKKSTSSTNTKSKIDSISREKKENAKIQAEEAKQKIAEEREKEKKELLRIRQNERNEREERLKLRIASRQESEERLKLSTQRRMDSITPSYWFDNDKRYTFKFNRYASNYGEMASDDELKEVTKKIPIQDFRKKNSINLNDETKKTTDGFKDLNKQLDKINNKLNLFAVGLSALKLFDIGMEKHKESQQNIHYGYGAGLNYRETKVFGGIAEGFGINKEGLYEEIGEWRRLKDRWGTGTPNLFASEEQQKFLLGNAPTSLGYSLEKLQGMNPVQIYEMVIKDLFIKMKANPSMAGAYEAQARVSGFGNAGTLAFKGALSGVSIEEFMRTIKNVVDTPFGREKSTFEFSTELSQLMTRFGNSIDKLTMTFEKYLGSFISFLNNLPFLSTSSERKETSSKMIQSLIKDGGNGLSNNTIELMQKYNKQNDLHKSVLSNLDLLVNDFFEGIGIKSSHTKDEIILKHTLNSLIEKDYLDNDYMDAKKSFIEIVMNRMESGDIELLEKSLDTSRNIKFYNLKKLIKSGDKNSVEDWLQNNQFMRNESEWQTLHSQKNDVGMTYDSRTNANNGVTIIIEDKTNGGIKATGEYSNGVQTLSQ